MKLSWYLKYPYWGQEKSIDRIGRQDLREVSNSNTLIISVCLSVSAFVYFVYRPHWV